MPPVAAQPVERKPHFVKAPGKDTLMIVRQHTERLRGTDPLVVVPRGCKGLGWLHAVKYCSVTDCGRSVAHEG